MASLRGLGDEVSLVLTLYEGKDFISKCLDFKESGVSDSPVKLIAVASLNSIEDQTSDPVEFTSSEPFVNTEFEWSMSRQHFQAIRSRKVMLKVQFFVTYQKINETDSKDDHATKHLIGNIFFDLKEAIPMSVPKQSENNKSLDTSYAIHANWKTLVNVKTLAGRPNPSMKYALILEPKVPPIDDENNSGEPEVAQITAQKSLNANLEALELGTSAQCSVEFIEGTRTLVPLIPILREEKGYFVLGNEENASEMYYFNVFITYGKNLHQGVSAENSGLCRQGSKYHFSYKLFGIDISTETFENLYDTTEDFLAEKASARILTNSDTLEKFFKEILTVTPFKIDLCTEKTVLSCCNIDVSSILNVSKESLLRGDLIEYEGVALMENANKNSNNSINISTVIEGIKLASDSDDKTPHIGIRMSVGKTKDDGLESNESLTDDVQIDSSMNNVIDKLNIDQLPNLKLNDTLQRVNLEFEQNFVYNSLQANNQNTSIEDQEIIVPQGRGSSKTTTAKSLQRPLEEVVLEKKSLIPRPEPLQTPKLPVKDHSSKHSNDSSIQKVTSDHEDQAILALENKDYSTTSSSPGEQTASSPPEITAKVLQSNVRKPSTSPQLSVPLDIHESRPGKNTNKPEHVMDVGKDPLSNTINEEGKTSKNFKSNELQNKFRFVINLESIALTLDKPVNCIIKYRSRFSPKEISTTPAFTVNPSKADEGHWFWTAIQNGYCEFSFSSKLSSLRKNFQKHSLVLHIYNQNDEASTQKTKENNAILIGKASLDLSMIFTDGNASSLPNEIKCNLPVPIFGPSIKSSPTPSIIGKIFCNIALRDLGETSVPKEEQSPKTNTRLKMFGKENHDNTNVQTKRTEELAALDIEKWKYKQKERFQQQLEKLEQHHMNTLSEEWNKR